jgi:hypothetical protein
MFYALSKMKIIMKHAGNILMHEEYWIEVEINWETCNFQWGVILIARVYVVPPLQNENDN